MKTVLELDLDSVSIKDKSVSILLFPILNWKSTELPFTELQLIVLIIL